jgi:ribosomal protein L7/L12
MSQPPAPRRYEHPAGHHVVRCYPVEGETFAELWFGDSAWGRVTISGIHHDRAAEARVADARFLLSLYPPPSSAAHEWWDFDLDDVRTQLDEARAWLLGNEQGAQPVDWDALTAAGKAFSKIGTADREQLWMVPPASNTGPPDAGTGGLALVLVSAGPTPIGLIKKIREITGLGLMDTRALLETCPSVVITGMTEADAALVRRTLEWAGATTEIRVG